MFNRPPFTAYRRHPDKRNFLKREKLSTNFNLKKYIHKIHEKVWKRVLCLCKYSYIKERKSVKINNKECTVKKKTHDCGAYNIVYSVIGKKEKCK